MPWNPLDVLTGDNVDRKDRQSGRLMDKALDTIRDVETPEFEEFDPEYYEYQGDYNPYTMSAGRDVVFEGYDPALADVATVDQSAFNDISVDPRIKDSQLASLGALDELVEGGGWGDKDEAMLARLKSDTAQADKGRRDAILQNMGMRGMGGSGMELLAQLDSSQAATDRLAQGGLDIAGMAGDRALQAISQQGSLAGQMRGQDFNEQGSIANANDAIARFNAQNLNSNSMFNVGQFNAGQQFNSGNQLRTDMYNKDNWQDTQRYNTDALNQAGFAGWETQQGIRNANTDVSNNAQQQNKYGIPQQQFENDYKKAASVADVYGSSSDKKQKDADREAAKNSSMIGAGAAVGAAAASDKRLKNNVKDLDNDELNEFLSAVKPKTYKYKNPSQKGQQKGDRIGFIMQDVKDTKIGKKIMKKDKKGNMYYDKDNLDGVLLAALSSLAKGEDDNGF